MPDGPLVPVRFALYADLGLLFGLPFFLSFTRQGAEIWRMFRLARVIAILAAAGLALSLLGFAILAAQMSGTTLGQLDPSIAETLLAQTALGWALIARVAALVLALGAALLAPEGLAKRWLLAGGGAVAVATLAWSGHGAAEVGAPGALRLGGDIVHLLAASAWIGALALLLALVSPRGPVTRARVETAHDALAGFSGIGTLIVGLIVATGLINGGFTVGVDGLTTLPRSPYGRLLLAKLLLFAAMLGCAALNRFRLTPALQAALDRGRAATALARLRRSVAVEDGARRAGPCAGRPAGDARATPVRHVSARDVMAQRPPGPGVGLVWPAPTTLELSLT